jgi:DNA-damage-inducible protein D
MAESLSNHPSYAHTISQLEAVKRRAKSGMDYWLARDINELLGYPTWREFKAVIERAKNAMAANGVDPSHQIVVTHKLMEVAGGARLQGEDFFLSRPACRLIAMNGDPRKPEIAGAQAYFVVQAHRMEQVEALSDDEKRLELRERVKTAFRTVSGVAKDAGVTSSKQAFFHDARYQGLYGMSRRDVLAKKGMKSDDNPFDYAGPLELSANEFQMNMAADVIKKENVKGEYNLISRNRNIAQHVRNTMKSSGATLPENLPKEEPIREVAKRVKAQRKALPKS